MKIEGRNKVKPEFNMSSMTDIVIPITYLFYVGFYFGDYQRY